MAGKRRADTPAVSKRTVLTRSWGAWVGIVISGAVICFTAWALGDIVIQSTAGGIAKYSVDGERVPIDFGSAIGRATGVALAGTGLIAVFTIPRRTQVRSVERASGNTGYGQDWRAALGTPDGVPSADQDETVVAHE